MMGAGIGISQSNNVMLIHNNVFENLKDGLCIIDVNIRVNKVFDNGSWRIWRNCNSLCSISRNRGFRNKIGGVRVGYRAAGKDASHLPSN